MPQIRVDSMVSAMFLFRPLLFICDGVALVSDDGYGGFHYEESGRHYFPPLGETSGRSLLDGNEYN